MGRVASAHPRYASSMTSSNAFNQPIVYHRVHDIGLAEFLYRYIDCTC